MIDTTELEAALKLLEAQQGVLQKKIRDILRELRRMKSQNFIEANTISLSDVEKSSGSDRPWFGDVYKFMDWLKTNSSSKRFVEWNGRLHFASDLQAGKFKPTPGQLEELPELET